MSWPPPLDLDWPVVIGDPWTVGFPAFSALTQLPQSLAGYSADFSLRANFGDAAPIIAMTSAAPSANGSTIAINPYAGSPGTGVSCVVTPLVVAADTLLLVPSVNVGAKTTRFWYRIRIIDPTGAPTTIVQGSWYARTQV